MIVGFSKLFSDIVHSTVWREDMHVKVVWITMLAMSDRYGLVMSSIPGLADSAKVSLDQCLDALQRLSSPDVFSRTKDYEGRRITEVEGGWLLLNYEKYRARKDDEEQRLRTRDRVRKHRERQNVTGNVTVTQSNPIAEADTESEALNTTALPLGLSEKTWQDFKEHRKAIKAKLTPNAETRLLKKLARMVEAGENPEDVVGTSIEQGWRGLFPTRKHGTHQKPDNSAIGRVRRANASKSG